MSIDAFRGSMNASKGPSMHPGGLCLSMHPDDFNVERS